MLLLSRFGDVVQEVAKEPSYVSPHRSPVTVLGTFVSPNQRELLIAGQGFESSSPSLNDSDAYDLGHAGVMHSTGTSSKNMLEANIQVPIKYTPLPLQHTY